MIRFRGPLHLTPQAGAALSAVLATFTASLLALSLFAGCVYRLGAVDREIPGGYRAIAIPVFKNNTSETGVEVAFTNALIRELERARIGRITNRSQAQVTLEGTVDWVHYIYDSQILAIPTPVPGTALPAGVTPNYLPGNTTLNTEYRILMQTTIRLRRNSDQKILWEGSFNGERSYLSPRIGEPGLNSANALYDHSARFSNIESMAKDMMYEAHERITENF